MFTVLPKSKNGMFPYIVIQSHIFVNVGITS